LMMLIPPCLLGRTVLPLCAALLACSPRKPVAVTSAAAAASQPVPPAGADSSRGTADSFPWLVADTAARTATLELVVSRKAGAPSALINGYRAGEARIIIPLAWTVKWDWRSADSTAPHSLVWMVQREKIPLEGGRASFTNAMTRMVVEGLRPGQSDQSTFIADEAGWYWMLCGVPGHAVRGEWLEVRVDPESKTAKVEMKKKT
jgi:Sulfocyanin (SoxE) domain